MAAREWIIGNFATARETKVAKDVAVGTVDTEVLRAMNPVSVFTMRQEWCPYKVALPSYMTGGNTLPLIIMSRGSLISSGVGGAVADGSS